ncbi:MAG TPA: diguanylate cyclase [Spirochaetales bacterium]|nr:diguanylate cyclase [Spirochaetales bacterium]HRY55739.1 diguanylate cyclase [Spirochaetia bacterium]HRZ65143.1 diguanylate cyclase [Spirochaetia bacterium]
MKLLRQSTINVSASLLFGLALPLLMIEGLSLRRALDSAMAATEREKEISGIGNELREASDFLSDEVRAYAATGDRERLEAFWREVLVERRRERAMGRLAALGIPAGEAEPLERAKAASDALLETELLAMRLVVEAGEDRAGLPAPVAAAGLPPPFAALSAAAKVDLARELVFGPAYLAQKRLILGSVDEFRSVAGRRSAAEAEEARRASRKAFGRLLAIGSVTILLGILLVALYYFALALPIRRYIGELAGPEPGAGIPELEPRGTLELMALAVAFNERRAERLRFEAALSDSERRYRTHLELMPLGAVEVDARNRIKSWNPAAERIFGYPESEVLGRNLVELIVPEDIKPEIAGLIDRLNQGETISTHVNRNLRKDGAEIVCEWYNTPLFDSRGAWVGWASIVKDITDQRKEAERILYLSRHDPLTGLLNRRSLAEKIEEEASRSARTGEPYALAMLDIDHFKDFNDRHGHECGDVVLKAVAEAMLATARSTDSVGRWGGEEFLLLLPATDAAGGGELAEKIRSRVERASVPYGGASCSVTVTAGVAACGRGDPGIDGGIRRADEALLEGKRQGRNRVVVAAEAGKRL